MATNLAINQDLLNTALSLGGRKTKKETVNLALKEFISRRRVKDISGMFGSVEYDKNYNYKALRVRE